MPLDRQLFTATDGYNGLAYTKEMKLNAAGIKYLAELSEAALNDALAAWRAATPDLGVLALLPEDEKNSITTLQAACTRHCIPLVGAVFPVLIEAGIFKHNGALLFGFDRMPYCELHANLPRDAPQLDHITEKITANIRAAIADDESATTLLMLFDAMVPNIASILDDLYLKLANRVHYAGVNAGSETFQPMPCLFDATRVVQNGVLLLLLKQHGGVAVEHDYVVPPELITATSAEGNRIIQINWRPAFEVYQELVRKQFGVDITRDNFYQYSVHFPFGIVRANHQTLVRIPVMLDDSDALFCVGEVPPNSILALLHPPVAGATSVVGLLNDELHKLNSNIAGNELMLFYCAGRRLHLGVATSTGEVADLAARSGASQLAGALSLGEIGSSTLGGYPLFHNATLVGTHWHN